MSGYPVEGWDVPRGYYGPDEPTTYEESLFDELEEREMSELILSPLTEDQREFLAGLEDKGHNSTAVVGGNQKPDWASEWAIKHVRYLRRCRNEAEEIEYLAALLRLAETTGAQRGAAELASRITRSEFATLLTR